METITLSHLADMIIVISFAGLVGAALGTGLSNLIMFLGRKISAAAKKRKSQPKQ